MKSILFCLDAFYNLLYVKIIRSKRVIQFIVHRPNRSLIARKVLIGQCSLQNKTKRDGFIFIFSKNPFIALFIIYARAIGGLV